MTPLIAEIPSLMERANEPCPVAPARHPSFVDGWPPGDRKLLDAWKERTGQARADILAALPALLAHGERMEAALEGLIAGVEQHCNEPGGGGISGYLSARLTDARAALNRGDR